MFRISVLNSWFWLPILWTSYVSWSVRPVTEEFWTLPVLDRLLVRNGCEIMLNSCLVVVPHWKSLKVRKCFSLEEVKSARLEGV